MEFSLGQIIPNDRNYTAASLWCNQNSAIIMDIGNGNYQIQALPEKPILTLHEQALLVTLTKREFLKLVLALTETTETPISLTDIESYVAAAPDEIHLEWDYATYVERKHPLLDNVAQSFGISADMLDIMFAQKDELLHKIENNIPLHEG